MERVIVRRRTTPLLAALAAIVALAGCGSSAPRPDPGREARLVAEMNANCRSYWDRPAHPSTREEERGQARTAALERALKQAAAYLPAGRALNEADARRRALEAEMRRASRPSAAQQRSFRERFRTIEEQVSAAIKALGLGSCPGPLHPIPG